MGGAEGWLEMAVRWLGRLKVAGGGVDGFQPAVGGCFRESSQVRRKLRLCVGYTVCSLRRDGWGSHKGYRGLYPEGNIHY